MIKCIPLNNYLFAFRFIFPTVWSRELNTDPEYGSQISMLVALQSGLVTCKQLVLHSKQAYLQAIFALYIT